MLNVLRSGVEDICFSVDLSVDSGEVMLKGAYNSSDEGGIDDLLAHCEENWFYRFINY